MKSFRLLTILVILLVALLGFLGVGSNAEIIVLGIRNKVGEDIPAQEDNLNGKKGDELSKSPFSEYLEPLYETPSRLFSHDVILDLDLTPTGVDERGQLEAPQDWHSGGWYFGSAIAGEKGNVLISGHYDAPGNVPAAFYNLKSLKVNDTVYLADSHGRVFPYRVTTNFYIGIYEQDRIEKLLESEGASLTLITCGGVWLPEEGTYNKRLVVKAVRED